MIKSSRSANSRSASSPASSAGRLRRWSFLVLAGQHLGQLGDIRRDFRAIIECQLFEIVAMPSRPTGSADYFFIVIVIRHETTAAARWALPLIVRALFNDTITVTIGTGFHVCLPVNNRKQLSLGGSPW
jgi:hypothetical protein